MKKIIFTTFLLLITIVQPAFAATWLNCPFGNINDPYPGLCARYTDTDGDNICDNSQPPPEDRVAGITQTSQQKTEIKFYVIEITIIILLLWGLAKYLVYFSQQTQNRFLQGFNQKNYRFAMNILLLCSFCLTGTTALMYLARLQLGWFKNLGPSISFWHIEFGLIMAILALIHIIERWRFFIRK